MLVGLKSIEASSGYFFVVGGVICWIETIVLDLNSFDEVDGGNEVVEWCSIEHAIEECIEIFFGGEGGVVITGAPATRETIGAHSCCPTKVHFT